MPRTLPSGPDRPFPLVLASHAGLACEGRETAAFPLGIGGLFVLQKRMPADRKPGRPGR
jgi:hypothetical protein